MNFEAQFLNINDFVLILIAFLSLLLAALISFTPNKNLFSKFLFATFILIFGLVSVQRLLLFSEVFNHWVVLHGVDYIFLISCAYWIQPPILYLYTRSVVNNTNGWQKNDAYHFLPTVLFFVYMYFAFWQYDSVVKAYLLEEYRFYNSHHFFIQNYLRAILAVSYVCLAINLIRDGLPEKRILISQIDDKSKWLLLLLFGYVFITIIRMIGYTIGVTTSFGYVADILGLLCVYVELVLICTVIGVGYHLLPKLSWKIEKRVVEINEIEKTIDEKYQRIIDYFEKEKPFLNPNTNLQQISKSLDIPSRTVSMTIKRWSEKSFYEFLSFYRITEAKKLLMKYSSKEKSISMIYEMCGFNNRVAFNNAFKKHVGTTATDFRSQYH